MDLLLFCNAPHLGTRHHKEHHGYSQPREQAPACGSQVLDHTRNRDGLNYARMQEGQLALAGLDPGAPSSLCNYFFTDRRYLVTQIVGKMNN